MEKEKEELIPVRIAKEGKHQLAIRFPKKVVEALDIDPKKDLWIFAFDKKNLHLKGEIVDKEKFEEETIE